MDDDPDAFEVGTRWAIPEAVGGALGMGIVALGCADVNADDVMRLVFTVTAGVYVDDPQRERAIGIVLDGIRASVG